MKTERRRHPKTGEVWTFDGRTVSAIGDGGNEYREFDEADWLSMPVVEDAPEPEPEPEPVELIHDGRFMVCRVFDGDGGQLEFRSPWGWEGDLLHCAINGGPGWRYRGVMYPDDERIWTTEPKARHNGPTIPDPDKLTHYRFIDPDRVVFERVGGE